MHGGSRSGFLSEDAAGDLIVAGKNFGCGSSREHAPMVIRECGVSCVIAATFCADFLPECDQHRASDFGVPGGIGGYPGRRRVSVDFDTGVICNLTTGKTYQAQPFPPFIQNIIQKGGLLLTSVKNKEQRQLSAK